MRNINVNSGPIMLQHLRDCIFEGLPNDLAKLWPERFMSAIKSRQDLPLVGWDFLHWLLTDETINPGITHELVKREVKQCAIVLASLANGETLDAVSAAWRAAKSAESAAKSAVSAAWCAANSAESTAESAVGAAWCAAKSAESAAESAVSAARNAEHARIAAWDAAEYAAESARFAARHVGSAAYLKMADKLIFLIECKEL